MVLETELVIVVNVDARFSRDIVEEKKGENKRILPTAINAEMEISIRATAAKKKEKLFCFRQLFSLSSFSRNPEKRFTSLLKKLRLRAERRP